MDATITLYRPVGRTERDLIAASGYREFPPRLSWQPIFYPVLEEEYAIQIARDWNTKDELSGFEGHVTRFRVRAEFLAAYPIHTVGGRQHREYWIPAEELPALHTHLDGEIEVIHSFYREASEPG